LKALTITSILKNCEISALAIMPDHLHLIMYIGNYSTTKIMQLFKSFSAVEINKRIEERGAFHWQKSFTDHLIRSNEDLRKLHEYTLDNPIHHKKFGFTWFSPNTMNPEYVARHDRMVALVEDMLSTQKQYHSAETEADQKTYQQKIELLDRQIDHLVYELYGLTEEEIRIVDVRD